MKSLNITQIAELINGNQPAGLILVGPPLSGKSTFIAKLLNLGQTLHIASTDDIIEREAKAQGKTYSEIFKEVKFGIIKQEMMHSVMRAKEAHANIVFDQTSMSRKSRTEKLNALAGFTRIAIVFDYNLAELHDRNIIRNEATGKWIPANILDTMISSYQAPTLAEGFHHVIKLSAI